MKNTANHSNSQLPPNESTLTFTYPELLALNKVLGRVNGAAPLTAEDLYLFTMSPLVASAFKKIHQAMLVGLRKDLERKNIKRVPKEVGHLLQPDKDFQLGKVGSFTDTKQLFQQLEEDIKHYIRSLEGDKLRSYCELYFAPFIPTEAHIEKLMGILKEL